MKNGLLQCSCFYKKVYFFAIIFSAYIQCQNSIKVSYNQYFSVCFFLVIFFTQKVHFYAKNPFRRGGL